MLASICQTRALGDSSALPAASKVCNANMADAKPIPACAIFYGYFVFPTFGKSNKFRFGIAAARSLSAE